MQPAAERFWETLERHSGIALVEGPRQLSYAEVEVDKPHALRFADSVSITLAGSR
ncbi:hypothetical protein OMR07_12420 [Methylobacterium organophilum]|nr:hypothetical protein [Methylobacterium organophilum]